MDKEIRAIQFEAFIVDSQVICAEIQGMRWENEQCIVLGHSIVYDQRYFIEKAEELRLVSQSLRDLIK